jgi:hypothetical protein
LARSNGRSFLPLEPDLQPIDGDFPTSLDNDLGVVDTTWMELLLYEQAELRFMLDEPHECLVSCFSLF